MHHRLFGDQSHSKHYYFLDCVLIHSFQIQLQSEMIRNQGESKSHQTTMVSKPVKEEEIALSYTTNRLWLFGIPIQYCYEQIKELFETQKQVKIHGGQWMHEESMEFIQLQLAEPVEVTDIYSSFSMKIDRYPFITLPGLKSKRIIVRQLQKFTVQIRFSGIYPSSVKKGTHKEEELMELMDEVGGVAVLIRSIINPSTDYPSNNKGKHLNFISCFPSSNDSYLQYIAVFNNPKNIEEASRQLKRQFPEAEVLPQPTSFIRVGRIKRAYTFENLMKEYSEEKSLEIKQSVVTHRKGKFY